MALIRFRLDRAAISRLCLGLLGLNLVFTAGTAGFMREWAHRDWHGPAGIWAIDHLLVQFHLATENVVAAWYSSMLLLTVALAAAAAFLLDAPKTGIAPVFGKKRGQPGGWLRFGWLIVAAAFATLSLDELGSLHERIGMVTHGAAPATGWVYVLLVPIGAVALFMLAFAWFHIRRVPAAAGLFVLGTGLFLSDPVFELFEMSLLHAGRGNDLIVHNTLLVIEEGVVELGGALAFLTGVLVYIRRTAGDGPHEFRLSDRTVARLIVPIGLLMTAAVPAAHWLVRQLPARDTGIPDNWFPAAALYGLALLALGLGGRGSAFIAAGALALSAAFGASLYGYSGWFVRIGYPAVLLDAAVTAGAALVALAACSRRPAVRNP